MECKNRREDAASAAEIKKFATDVRLAGCRWGVFVSTAGISGAKRSRDATYAVRKLYHADGTVIMVLRKPELESIVRQQVTLAHALRARYEAIRFDY